MYKIRFNIFKKRKSNYFAIQHKALWLWLSWHPDQNKSEWPEWFKNGGNIPEVKVFDFACDVSWPDCLKCPLQWPLGIQCQSEGSLYKQFCFCQSNSRFQRAKRIAEKIANLKWKEKP